MFCVEPIGLRCNPVFLLESIFKCFYVLFPLTVVIILSLCHVGLIAIIVVCVCQILCVFSGNVVFLLTVLSYFVCILSVVSCNTIVKGGRMCSAFAFSPFLLCFM